MEKPTPKSPLYLGVWRWHFYAGIFVIPLMLLLSVTGAIYLFKFEFEQWWYRDLLKVQPRAGRLSAERLVATAKSAFPGKSVIGYPLPPRPMLPSAYSWGPRAPRVPNTNPTTNPRCVRPLSSTRRPLPLSVPMRFTSTPIPEKFSALLSQTSASCKSSAPSTASFSPEQPES